MHLRMEKVFKEGRAILGGNFWLGQTRHSGREIFGSGKKITKIYKKILPKFENFIFF